MIEHDCSDICLYCIVTGLYEKIYKLRESNHKLAIEVLTLRKEKEEMDKLINKVSKDVSKKDLPKAKKDIKVLKKADQKFDKKIEHAEKMEKCDMKMKKKK